jgi:hypothetical protein
MVFLVKFVRLLESIDKTIASGIVSIGRETALVLSVRASGLADDSRIGTEKLLNGIRHL